MTRFVAGALCALLLLPVGVAAKVITVQNPMTVDLDGGGHDIANVTNYHTSAGAIFGGDGFDGWHLTLAMNPQTGPLDCTQGCTLDFAGTADPAVSPPIGNNPVGSLYRRRVDASHGELWFKVGPAATDWQRISP